MFSHLLSVNDCYLKSFSLHVKKYYFQLLCLQTPAGLGRSLPFVPYQHLWVIQGSNEPLGYNQVVFD